MLEISLTPITAALSRANFSILGAQGKLNLWGPQNLFMQKLFPIIQQLKYNINTLLHACMHAYTILTL